MYEGIERDYDLGGGHRLASLRNEKGEVVGFIEDHPKLKKTKGKGEQSPLLLDSVEVCSGYIALEGAEQRQDAPKWHVVQVEPLTLEPSILCTQCGNHGWVRNGRWVQA